MTFWKRLFGKKREYDKLEPVSGKGKIQSPYPKPELIGKSVTGALSRESLSEEASDYISQALSIIESHVHIVPGYVQVISTGSEGIVMEAARKLEAAFQLHPKNPLLHYAYASCLHLAMQFKSAEGEMRKCAETHPDFILAKLALEGWGKWQSMFTLPPWGINTTAVPPALSQMVKTGIMLAVRDSIVPRAALFLRDARGDFQNLQALRSARITLASVISPVRNSQVVGIYAKIYDDPSSPYDVEVLDIPFTPRGDVTRARYEYLCIQEDIDFVVIDGSDRILLNKRLPIPPNMQRTNDRILRMLEASDGMEVSTSELANAILRHQQGFRPSDVRY